MFKPSNPNASESQWHGGPTQQDRVHALLMSVHKLMRIRQYSIIFSDLQSLYAEAYGKATEKEKERIDELINIIDKLEEHYALVLSTRGRGGETRASIEKKFLRSIIKLRKEIVMSLDRQGLMSPLKDDVFTRMRNS